MNRLPRVIIVALVLCLAAAGCASVDPLDAELTLDTRALQMAANRENAPTPTQADDIDTNDQGEQLLPRFITASYRTDDDCEFFSYSELEAQPDCGWLTRPLHGAYKDDIELPVVTFKATGDNPQPDPIIYLHGGPTDGILSILGYQPVYDILISPYVEDRDVIVFDQRGTGLAEPQLGCDAPTQWFNANDEEPETFVSRTATVCAIDLQVNDGIRLNQFSRQTSADDVMALAREMGYESFNIHGSSWGGILGYTVMQLHPEWVRSAILDSPLSTQTDVTGSMPGSFYEAMEGLQANCERSPGCVERHGNIIDRYIRVSDSLAENPVNVLVFDVFTLPIDADELSYLLFGLFYDTQAVVAIPDLLLELENGGTAQLQQLINYYGWGWGVDFTFLTYMCSDIVSTSSVEQVEAQQIGIEAFDRVDDAPDGRGHSAKEICERMRVEQPAAPTLSEVRPTTPLLVFAGRMDPITAYSSGEQIVNDSDNATFVGFEDQSHGVTHTPCALEIIDEFLANPQGQPDISCSQDRPFLEFDPFNPDANG